MCVQNQFSVGDADAGGGGGGRTDRTQSDPRRAKVKKKEARLARDWAFEVFDKWLRFAMRTADQVREGGFGLSIG